MIPWFKHCRKEVIDQYINAVHKVIDNRKELPDLQSREEKRRKRTLVIYALKI